MPKHVQVTTCRLNGGPVSSYCHCEHCTLAVCKVCGAWEAGLPTHCPGQTITFAQMDAISAMKLDYTDAEGWHMAPEGRPRPEFEERPAREVEKRTDFVSRKRMGDGVVASSDVRIGNGPMFDARVDRFVEYATPTPVKGVPIVDTKSDTKSDPFARWDKVRELAAGLERAAIAWVLAERKADELAAAEQQARSMYWEVTSANRSANGAFQEILANRDADLEAAKIALAGASKREEASRAALDIACRVLVAELEAQADRVVPSPTGHGPVFRGHAYLDGSNFATPRLGCACGYDASEEKNPDDALARHLAAVEASK